MSTVNRTTSRGGKGAKQESSATGKSQKTDTKSESPKSLDHHPKTQPTAEQMRIAQIIETKPEDPDLKDKIKQVMDATRKSEDEVVTALHDCDNDPNKAVNMLLEGIPTGWETTSKKKKNRQPSAAKTEATVNNRDTEQEEWDREGGAVQERDRSRIRGGGPPRMRGGRNDARRWRGRENKENEKNLEESRGEGFYRGGGGGRVLNGPGRSGRGGRGGGRLGPRTFQSRDKTGFPRSIDTWNNPTADDSSGGDPLKMEKWGEFPSPEDWDNEEYTGSLADSKVFTPSGGTVEPVVNSEPVIPTQEPTTELSSALTSQTLSSSVASSSSQMSQNLEIHQSTTNQLSQSPVPVGVNQLNSTQSEYLNQLSQATENLKSAVGIGTSTSAGTSFGTTSSSSYTVSSSSASSYQPPSPPSGFTSSAAPFSTSSYVSSSSTYSPQIQEQPAESPSTTTQSQSIPTRTKTQRPRVPPPSKIPATAVEMPGDAINSSIGYLDVQFGALEFGSETNSFETSSEQNKFSNSVSNSVLDSLPSPRASTNLDLSTSQTSALDAYTASSTQKSSQNSIASSLSQSQKLPGSESILSTSDHKVSQSSFTQTRSSTASALDVDKSEVGLSYSAPSTVTYQSTYQNQKSSSVYPTASSYTPSNYSSVQVTSSTTTYSSQHQQPPQLSYTSSSNSAGSSTSYSSQSAAAANPYPAAASSYSQQASAAAVAAAAYQPAPYPGVVAQQTAAAAAFPAQPAYQPAPYGTSALASAAYAGTGASSQYQNNYGTPTGTQGQGHVKLASALGTSSKEPQYDATTTSSSSLSSTNVTTANSGLSSSVNAAPALGLVSTNQTVNTTSTKVTSSTGVSLITGKSSVVPNIPPGVPPMLSTPQYIMSQGGLPYFQQPVYSFEEIQLLQQRIPHMAPGYYDMSFQAPTSLSTGREGGLASVAYSMSDGRYTRGDNNASPVPSTLSQQNATQAHQQPMLNPSALPPGYAYFYGGGMMPGSFQYGTPAIYQMPPATNAHGTTTTSQYPKPGTYGSGYASGYDGLTQNQDYSKTGYVAGSQSQSKTGVGANTGSTGSSGADLSATMYGKSHVAIGKVNSYDKQGFHSGTPPPFNLPGSQSTPIAPSGAYTPHLFIPAIPPHQQHHSTTLMHQPLHQV
ncbi:protein lingerer isoform X3 [Schistocerca americana]|uniref:protein lingerer isoform X3 n=1 Tax=Schistocerca americana TaxID=7009 RepID=UPI001F502966|nr:protein lingerer isoform X3 [Schistocerca americana]